MQFEPIIGLEVHVELKTKSKMFCGCPADHFGREPNSNTCPVCLGLPGALPVPNKKAVEWCIMLGLALNCRVNEDSYFERKNYFYPDLPKGYQISQYAKPFCVNGSIVILGTSRARTPESKGADAGVAQHDEGQGRGKTIRINRVHMEEDTGKLLHSDQIPNYQGPKDVSLVDFNRSGVPLVEIVTEPDFKSTEEVVDYLKKLQLIVRYLGISDADMEKGSMRLEPTINLKVTESVSLSRSEITSEGVMPGDPALPAGRSSIDSGQGVLSAQARMTDEGQNYWKRKEVSYTPLVEIKNINSFKFVKQALEYEIKRQSEEFLKTREQKKAGNKATMGYNEAKKMTVLQRSKEEAHDYRYFPEPDVPPMHFTKSQISNLKSQIPELPEAKVVRYIRDWSIKETEAVIIVENKNLAAYFETAAAEALQKDYPVSKLSGVLVNKRLDFANLNPKDLVQKLVQEKEQETLKHEELAEVCREAVEQNERAVSEYQNGKKESLQFLVGQVMKISRGRAEPQLAASVLKDLLK